MFIQVNSLYRRNKFTWTWSGSSHRDPSRPSRKLARIGPREGCGDMNIYIIILFRCPITLNYRTWCWETAKTSAPQIPIWLQAGRNNCDSSAAPVSATLNRSHNCASKKVCDFNGRESHKPGPSDNDSPFVTGARPRGPGDNQQPLSLPTGGVRVVPQFRAFFV
jgi:hypothetical protein